MNDRIRFSCSTNGTEQTAIHRVDERSAIECRGPIKFVDSLIGTCMKANDSVIIRLREIPMLPNEMSYKPDHDYFFITTSTGEKNGLENGKGGLCQTNNMRLKIRVESKWTDVSQKKFNAKNGPVMMIPVNSGQYAVPVVYVPVAQSSEEGDKKSPVFPYHLYFANGQFRTTNSTLEELGPRAGIAHSYPFKNLVLMSGSSGVLHNKLRFDAGDQPKDIGNSGAVINSDGYVAPRHSAEKDVDFEIEYMDSSSSRSYQRFGAKETAIITSFIMLIHILL
uniref:Ephrin RBD domain-containing protein n=1 Tax=Setaria digitata TaxID=48799 RepID=A0A915Q0L1_9BILA